MKHIFFVIIAFVLFSSCTNVVDRTEEQFKVIYNAVYTNDTASLISFKRNTEIAWEKENTLVDYKIEVGEYNLTVKNGNTKTTELKKDTNIILEWNYSSNELGKITQETYNKNHGKFKSVSIILYQNDSIFAEGEVGFLKNDSLLFNYRLDYLKNKIYCNNCDNFTFSDYAKLLHENATFSNRHEFWVFDSTRRVKCLYRSSGHINWSHNSRFNNKLFLQSDSVIYTTGICDDVQIKSDFEQLNIPIESIIKNVFDVLEK